jgi:hypothetical protein
MVLIATDSLSLRKLPNAWRILPIAPGKDKQIREKIGTTNLAHEIDKALISQAKHE